MEITGQHSDQERDFYYSKLGVTSGSMNELEQQYLETLVTITSDFIADLYRAWFISLGYDGTKTNVDNWKRFLAEQGYTTNIYDDTTAYFADNA
jgi:hypothetical protein